MSGDLLRTKSIIAQFINATKDKNENVKFAMDETNINIWYVLLHGISSYKDEFVGGEYLFRIHIPEGAGKEWLKGGKPPRFIPLTPNGVYKINVVSCIGIGEYHMGSKVASMGVGDFVTQLVSGMIAYHDLKGGVNLVYTETDERGKQALAKKSVDFNKVNYPEVMRLINDSYSEYSKRFPVLSESSSASSASSTSAADRIRELSVVIPPVNNPKGKYDMNVSRDLEPNQKDDVKELY